MAKSKSQKLRSRQAKQRGYDLHERRRGLMPKPTRRTKTFDQTVNHLYAKHKKRNHPGDEIPFFCFFDSKKVRKQGWIEHNGLLHLRAVESGIF